VEVHCVRKYNGGKKKKKKIQWGLERWLSGGEH